MTEEKGRQSGGLPRRVHDIYDHGYGWAVEGPFPSRDGDTYRIEWDRPTPNQATARPVIPSEFFQWAPFPEETP